MKPDKIIKKELMPKFWNKPEKYYATEVLKEKGFERKLCVRCKKPFWTAEAERETCGDPSCSGEGFGFIGKSPAREDMDYIGVWKRFSSMFRKMGYFPIKRYPVVARWNPTMEYTNSSISAFQPYVISGEIEPPENPLVIPQFCLRFNDIDNVGITQSHNTGFVMIGQHMFVPPKQWDQNKVFLDIYRWLEKGLGLEKADLIFHEDAWAGGGNIGCCMEFFSRGCELGNQVYMLYEQTGSGYRELDIKVLDMGMGQERNAWFVRGSDTIYDASFPPVIRYLMKKTGIIYDTDLMKKYIPHAGLLNLDETDDINHAWEKVAGLVGTSVGELRDFISPLSGVYSIAEHTRSLLFALSDGALPSNVGGGYNLRVLARRAMSFNKNYSWGVDLTSVCERHAKYLKPMFPELSESVGNIGNILEAEGDKYKNMTRKSKGIISRFAAKGKGIGEKDLLLLYDSHGIPPEMVRNALGKEGISLEVPDDFYSKISGMHEQKKQKTATKKGKSIPLGEIPETRVMYYDDYRRTDFTAKVLRVIGRHVILDRSAFYPTSGGQMHDKGKLNGFVVKSVFRQGNVTVHELEKGHKLKKGDGVRGKIDLLRRSQLSKHHTATHIINAAARKVLGPHVNQAGARKTETSAHLDITHYASLSNHEIKNIEERANQIVNKGIRIEKKIMERREAEKRFGMRIYQGGAVPGKRLRIVNIPGVDVEACGGTHLNNTNEIGLVKILKASKVQDGVIRIDFTAGKAADNVSREQQAVFKSLVKVVQDFAIFDPGTDTAAQLRTCSMFFSVPESQLTSTVHKFGREAKRFADYLGEEVQKEKAADLGDACAVLFRKWKYLKKRHDRAAAEKAGRLTEKFVRNAKKGKIFEIVDMERKEMIKLSESILEKEPGLTVILVNKEGIVVGMSNMEDIVVRVKEICRECSGSGGGKGKLAQGRLKIKELKKKKPSL